MFSTILKIQPKTTSSALGKSNDEMVTELVDNLLD